jgi:hypothetical protein
MGAVKFLMLHPIMYLGLDQDQVGVSMDSHYGFGI